MIDEEHSQVQLTIKKIVVSFADTREQQQKEKI